MDDVTMAEHFGGKFWVPGMIFPIFIGAIDYSRNDMFVLI